MDYSFLDQFSLLWCSLGGDNFYIWRRRRGGLSLCGCSSLPFPSPPWSTAPITIPSSHTWTLRCGILDDEHWCFFDRDFIARCQQSMPCLLWSPVPCSNTCTLLSNADVTFLFGHWQGKNPCGDDGGGDIISLIYTTKNHHSHSLCGKLS